MADSMQPSNAELNRPHEKLEIVRTQQQLHGTTVRASLQPRVRLFYSDEGVRDRFCANAQRLLQTALDDPLANSTDALIALKALRYRKVLHRLDGLDPQDPAFDVSTFFGVEWCKDPPRLV